MATYQSETEQIRAAIASIWRDFRTRLAFGVGRMSIPTPPGEWTVGDWKQPPEESRLVFWAPWGSAYIVVRYRSGRDKWWANYYDENTVREVIGGGTLLNISSCDYDQSYGDAVQATLDFMHGEHPRYPDHRLRPE
jgi:hypothetical protein